MGRRSSHTSDQLRELIIQSTLEIVEQSGLAGISAREIARKVEYSPGTLYNIFDSLDDLVLHVGARVIGLLDSELAEVSASGSPETRLRSLAQACVRFSRTRPHLWSLISHNMSHHASAMPNWYLDELEHLIQRFEAVVSPILAESRVETAKLSRTGRLLWAGVLGVATLSLTDSRSHRRNGAPEELVDIFVSTYLAGLECRLAVKA